MRVILACHPTRRPFHKSGGAPNNTDEGLAMPKKSKNTNKCKGLSALTENTMMYKIGVYINGGVEWSEHKYT